MIAGDGSWVRDGLADVALDGMARDHRGLIISDLDQKIGWLNEAARAVLTLDPALRAELGQLLATGQRAQDELASIIARSATGAGEGVVHFLRGRGCYLLQIRRIYNGAWLYVDVSVDQGSRAVRYFDLSEVFGLTTTEKKTALLMLSGHSPSDVASVSGVAIDTVRSHIRAIYFKMNVANREQFFARANSLRMM